MTDYRYTLTVELLEDLHSGTGTGTLIIDRLQARDEKDRPVLNRTHLRGVLRDNTLRLGELGLVTVCQVKQLFGNSEGTRGNLECYSLRLEKQTDTVTWDATARRSGSRVPEDDSLRRTEYVPAGSVFKGTVILREADDTLCAALDKILCFTDRLGGERSRGSGLIKLTHSKETIVPQMQPIDFGNEEIGSRCLRLLLRNEEPLSFPRTGFPGNIIDSETHIPGRTLFGALCQWALDRFSIDQSRLLFDHQFSIGNVYPLPRGLAVDLRKALADLAVYPIPLNLYSQPASSENSGAAARNQRWPSWCDATPFATPLIDASLRDEFDQNINDENYVKGKRPKPNAYLFALILPEWWHYQVDLALLMRNRRGPPMGEVKRSEPDLFTVEQIPGGTFFMADILYPTNAPLSVFLELYGSLLQGDSALRVGRGGAPVTVEKFMFLKQAPTGTLTNAPDEANLLQVTLTSDLIARGFNLGFYQRLSVDALKAVLGTDVIDWNGIESADDKSDYELQRSFNAVSGLPRAPIMVIRRGSVIRLTGSGVARLREHLRTRAALGERTWEGYGRFVLDFYPSKEVVQPHSDLFPIVQSVNKTIGLREATIREAEQYAGRIKKSSKQNKTSPPSRSQLGQLLDEVRAAGDDANKEQLRGILDRFQQAATKKSGQAWRTLFSDKGTENDLREKLPQDGRSAQLFVQTLISYMELEDNER